MPDYVVAIDGAATKGHNNQLATKANTHPQTHMLASSFPPDKYGDQVHVTQRTCYCQKLPASQRQVNRQNTQRTTNAAACTRSALHTFRPLNAGFCATRMRRALMEFATEVRGKVHCRIYLFYISIFG